MWLSVETTKRVRKDSSPFEFMPKPIPANERVLVLHAFNGWKKQINNRDSIKHLEQLLKELKK